MLALFFFKLIFEGIPLQVNSQVNSLLLFLFFSIQIDMVLLLKEAFSHEISNYSVFFTSVMPSTDPTWSTNSVWATRDLPLLILHSQFFVNGKSSLSTLTCPWDMTNRIIHYIPHSGKCFWLICEALKSFSATSPGVWSWVSHSPSQSLVSASLKCFWRNRVGSG